LQFEQYALAADFLRASGQPSLDLAIAVYHSANPAAGLSELERIPAAERRGDYYVLRAQMLDSLGKATEAAESLNRGIRAAPTRADMYF
jgi:predicted RNA polymerase sigma factor